MTYQCNYCKKVFVKETSIEAHMCEKKRRHTSQHEPGIRMGFQAFVRFYQIAQGTGKVKTFDDFVDSAYYKAFAKFGRYCVDTKAIQPARFVEWLLKQHKKIDTWCSDRVYTEYLLYYLTVEAVDDALARAIEYSIDWNEKTLHPAHDCLRYGNTNAICYAITTGRISPWVIYNCESGQKFLSTLTPDQLSMIWSYINSDVWQRKFSDNIKDRAYAQEILTKAGW